MSFFNIDNLQDGDAHVATNPIKVLAAYDVGISNAISFLGPVTPMYLKVLSMHLEKHNIDTVTFI